MAPLVEGFPPSRLEKHVQRTPEGKTRKPPVDLKDCELKEMMQYFCDLNGPREDSTSRVTCKPVMRLFRSCANGLTVETTSWEGVHDEKR